jgi:hypothetical protein
MTRIRGFTPTGVWYYYCLKCISYLTSVLDCDSRLDELKRLYLTLKCR